MAPRKPRFQRNSFLRRYPAASGLAPSPAARSCPGRMTHQRGPHNPSDGNSLYRKAFNCNYTFGTGTDEWFITCTEFKESKYRFQRTSTWHKTRITRQLSIMKTPPRLIGWLRSTMERAIMNQARSTRRPPSITLVRHTKPRRRLTKNLHIRSSLQLELNLPVVIQDLATGSSPSGHGRAPTALETRGAFSVVAVFFLPAIEQKSYGYAGGIPLPKALFTRQLLPYGRQELHLPAGCRGRYLSGSFRSSWTGLHAPTKRSRNLTLGLRTAGARLRLGGRLRGAADWNRRRGRFQSDRKSTR